MSRKKHAITPRNFEEQNLRAFLDPFWVNEAWRKDERAVIARFEEWIKAGGKLVMSGAILDSLVFQECEDYCDILAARGDIIIEKEETFDGLAERVYVWTSAGDVTDPNTSLEDVTTPPSATFEDYVSVLCNKEKILALRDIVDKYGKPEAEWKKSVSVKKRDPLTDTMKEQLGLESDATRSEVVIACMTKDKMGMLASYMARHIARLTELHNCSHVFYADGSISLHV